MAKMEKGVASEIADCELSTTGYSEDANIQWGNEQDRLDMERLGQRQQLSV